MLINRLLTVAHHLLDFVKVSVAAHHVVAIVEELHHFVEVSLDSVCLIDELVLRIPIVLVVFI